MSRSIELGMKLSEILSEITDERVRQIAAEGWTPNHDDTHSNGELATAGACYARFAFRAPQVLATDPTGAQMPLDWPWEAMWWKPKDPRRDLIRAAALIVAEIERLDRLALNPETGTENDLSAKSEEA